MKNVLLLPVWMTSLKLYKNNNSDYNICLGKLDQEAFSAKYVIGFSLGALVALRDIKNIQDKIILINPLVPKRGVTSWLVQWVKFVTSEGLFLERQNFTSNPIRYIFGLKECIELINIDFSKTLNNVFEDKVTVIRGKRDVFYCDEFAVSFLHSKNINVIEVDAGHNWNEEIEKTLNNLLST